MVFHPDPHFEEPLSTETGGLMLFVQYPGPSTGGPTDLRWPRFNMKARRPIEEETVDVGSDFRGAIRYQYQPAGAAAAGRLLTECFCPQVRLGAGPLSMMDKRS